MFGGGGGLNPRKMQQMMKQMGIEVTEIDAVSVRIETADGDELVFDEPDVTRMDAQGQQTYQIVGEPEQREATGGADDSVSTTGEGSTPEASAAITDDDVELVAMRTGASEAEARAALEETDGDLAAAVEKLE